MYVLYDFVKLGVTHVGVNLGLGLCIGAEPKGFYRPVKVMGPIPFL